MRGLGRLLGLGLLLAALAACNQQRPDRDPLEQAFDTHRATMLWGEIDEVLSMIDPKVRATKMPSRLELDRWHQVDVSGYHEQGQELLAPDHARRVVALDIVNRHTQAVRTIVDMQEWRWDEKAERWWLVSGLPKLTSN
jgi:hypothetical protein